MPDHWPELAPLLRTYGSRPLCRSSRQLADQDRPTEPYRRRIIVGLISQVPHPLAWDA